MAHRSTFWTSNSHPGITFRNGFVHRPCENFQSASQLSTGGGPHINILDLKSPPGTTFRNGFVDRPCENFPIRQPAPHWGLPTDQHFGTQTHLLGQLSVMDLSTVLARIFQSASQLPMGGWPTNTIITPRPSFINHLASVTNHQSAFFIHQSSIIKHQPSTINHQSSIINHLSPIIIHHSPIINYQPSIINHHSSIIHHHLPDKVTHYVCGWRLGFAKRDRCKRERYRQLVALPYLTLTYLALRCLTSPHLTLP